MGLELHMKWILGGFFVGGFLSGFFVGFWVFLVFFPVFCELQLSQRECADLTK